MLQHAVTTNSYEIYKKYSKGIYDLPIINLRDLLDFKKINKQIDIKEVESITNLRKDLGVEACLTALYHPKLMKH